jgi:hypothetical protein
MILSSTAVAQTNPVEDSLQVTVSYNYYYHHSGCPVPYPCETQIKSVSFTGSTKLTPVNGGYRGNGTGIFTSSDDIKVDPYLHCPAGDSHHMATNGEADVKINYMFSIDNNVTGGPDTSMYNSSYGVVEFIIEDNDLHTELHHEICGETTESFSHDDGHAGYDCHFYSMNFEDGGSFTAPDHDDPLGTCYVTIGPVEEQIDVQIEPEEIFLKFNLDQTGVEETPKAKVTVTLTMNGSPVKGKAVMIKVCTLPGTETTDGHIGHDPRAAGWEKTWDQPCDQDDRPFAVLQASSGKKGNVLVERTDNNGKIVLDYTPPISDYKGKKYPKYHYIAGEDEVIATAIHGAPSLQDKDTVKTKVKDLIQMPGSDGNCERNSNLNYTFGAQDGSKHGCIFYGTSEANRALTWIADQFIKRQKDCSSNPGSAACQVSYAGNLHNVTIRGAPQEMRINAMSLAWGGITDNVKGTEWMPPHLSHNDGRQVDLSFGIFKNGLGKNNLLCNGLGKNCKNYDIDRIMLLHDISYGAPGFYRMPSDEGADLRKTFAHPAPHIHIFFSR